MVDFGREICGNFDAAQVREWLVTNGIGGYASGTVGGLLTRGYHGLLVAALKPPLGRTLLVAKVDETASYNCSHYPLGTNRWANDTVEPRGYWHIERFYLEGTTPVWNFALGDALLEKRIWMQPEANTTYVRYSLQRATQALRISIKAFVNYRDYHSRTQARGWQMGVERVDRGVGVTAFAGAVPFYLLTDSGDVSLANDWYYKFELARERDRGLDDLDDHLHAGTFETTIEPGGSFTFVASTEHSLNGAAMWEVRRAYEQKLLERFRTQTFVGNMPDWASQLVLAADQFIVNRPLPDRPDGKTIIAGYHWFSDWGRDTTISLPGLTIATGRLEVARSILRTFAKYVNRGMLPNRFLDDGTPPQDDNEYNTVDAPLWYLEASRAYFEAIQDRELLSELFPVFTEIIDWYSRGTRFNIHQDPEDGLIYAGIQGVQLTWMDAKIGDWVVTGRIGKPVEINALWYNALRTMSKFAQQLQQPYKHYDEMAKLTQKGFGRFWNQELGYCFDVLDSPNGNDASLRPNQIFAVSLSESPLTPVQQRSVVEFCGRSLLTSFGLRSLAPDNPQYQGHYAGDQSDRDSVYHQGTVWGWLIGPFVLAHLRVFNDPAQARTFLEPMAKHLLDAGLGTISEIFDGDAPMQPRGCIAQAWSVAEVLRALVAVEKRMGA